MMRFVCLVLSAATKLADHHLFSTPSLMSAGFVGIPKGFVAMTQFVVRKLVESQRPTSCSESDGRVSAAAMVPAKARVTTITRMVRTLVISPNAAAQRRAATGVQVQTET